MGRYSTYTPEIADEICKHLMNGMSLRKICLSDDMPTRETVFNWLDENEEFLTKYARARNWQAENSVDELDEIRDKVLSGELEPNAATSAFNIIKWKSSKLLPKKYGDFPPPKTADESAHLRVTVTHQILDALTVEQLEEVKMKTIEGSSE